MFSIWCFTVNWILWSIPPSMGLPSNFTPHVDSLESTWGIMITQTRRWAHSLYSKPLKYIYDNDHVYTQCVLKLQEKLLENNECLPSREILIVYNQNPYPGSCDCLWPWSRTALPNVIQVSYEELLLTNRWADKKHCCRYIVDYC